MRKGIRGLFLAKRRRRRELAGLPIAEKIRILVSLQRIAAGIVGGPGALKRRPWSIRA